MQLRGVMNPTNCLGLEALVLDDICTVNETVQIRLFSEFLPVVKFEPYHLPFL
jgi:hypothetical protein